MKRNNNYGQINFAGISLLFCSIIGIGMFSFAQGVTFSDVLFALIDLAVKIAGLG